MQISKQISISIFVIATMILIISIFAWFITTKDMGRMHSSIKTVNHNLHLMNDLQKSIQNVSEGVFDQKKNLD